MVYSLLFVLLQKLLQILLDWEIVIHIKDTLPLENLIFQKKAELLCYQMKVYRNLLFSNPYVFLQ